MKVAIMQPAYLPWLGYFKLAHEVDHFVFYDDVQFSRQSWQQRNRIYYAKRDKNVWLTIPVASSSHFEHINTIQIPENREWAGEHWSKIANVYPDSKERDELSKIYWKVRGERRLIAVTIPLFKYLFFGLKLDVPMWHLSSELGVKGGKTTRLVNICRYLGATEYLSPVGSQDYLDETEFAKYGIKVSYLYIEPPHYYSALHSILTEGNEATGTLIRSLHINDSPT